MIEVNWGETITLYAPKYKKIEHFRTIEKAQYWLRCKWPEMTAQRSEALLKTQLAMDCLIPVGDAKNAFISAAHAAGYSTRTALQTRVFIMTALLTSFVFEHIELRQTKPTKDI